MTSVDDRDRVAVDPWCSAYSLGLSSRNPCPPVPVAWVDEVFVLGPVRCVVVPVYLAVPELVDGDLDGDVFRLP